jgi:hypothetical protein
VLLDMEAPIQLTIAERNRSRLEWRFAETQQ